MKISRIFLPGILALGFLQGPAFASAVESAHDHAETSKTPLTLDHGKPWGTDAALREGMSAMRTAMAARLHEIHSNTLDAAGYASLASTLQPALAGIFANCHLPPAADAQLHNILLPMNAAIERMSNAATAQEGRNAALAVMGGLADYGKTFDHPGWQPL